MAIFGFTLHKVEAGGHLAEVGAVLSSLRAPVEVFRRELWREITICYGVVRHMVTR